MNRFYVDKSQIGEQAITITDPDDVFHLAKVLRIATGAPLVVSDGKGGSYLTQVSRISKKEIVLKIQEKAIKLKKDSRKLKITLASAIPKYTDFEDIIDKTTQLGVDEIIPMFTERTQVKQDAFEKKKERFRRIMVVAAKQSGALFLPDLKEALPFSDLIRTVPQYDLCVLPNLARNSLSLKEALLPLAHKSEREKSILVLIGPEGDFTQQEIDIALQAGCRGVTLGHSVLRVDTAAIAVISFLRLFFKS